MNHKQPRPTRVNIILRPKAQDIALEGSIDGKFAVEDAKAIYDYMMLQSKKIKKPVKVYQPDPSGTTPVIKFNRMDNKPYMALLPEGEVTKARTAKIIL
jgi:hypothetical protein